MHEPLWKAMLDAASVGEETRVLAAACDGGGALHEAAKQLRAVFVLDADLVINPRTTSCAPGHQLRSWDPARRLR